jgi:membrane protein implicated in regulation of membrane protease activity
LAVDQTGRGYTDLTDFRAHNDLLTAEDLVLTPADITAVPGGNTVVVTGHTPPAWPWWVLGGCVALVSVLTAVFVLLRRRAKARFDGLFGPGAT